MTIRNKLFARISGHPVDVLHAGWKSTERTDAQGYSGLMDRADFRAGYADGFGGHHAGFGIDKRNPAYDAGFSCGRVDRPTSDRATTAEDIAAWSANEARRIAQ